MSVIKRYLVKTSSGSSYEVIDETHLFGSDKWVVLKDGKRLPIICFAKFRELKMEASIMNLGKQHALDGVRYIRALEDSIGNALYTRNCIGYSMVFVGESNFNLGLQWVKKIIEAQRVNDHTMLVDIWSKIERSMGTSTSIVDVVPMR